MAIMASEHHARYRPESGRTVSYPAGWATSDRSAAGSGERR